ncbi:MAG: GTP cyclohydrolase I FolE, partial [Legionellales bacterium]|nr:GTP cyclohydrolase I FolE [Legionellales bacterium]
MKVKDKKAPNIKVLPATATNVTKDEALAAVKTLIKWIGDNSTRE